MNFEITLFCDNDKYAIESCCAVHDIDPKLNIGNIMFADDEAVPDFNVMFGGSPCQDFSTAGNKAASAWFCRDCGHSYNPLVQKPTERDLCPLCGSKNLDKTRSSLLVEWLRFLRVKKPKFAIYENVKNIVGKRFRHTFNLFIAEVESYGYNAYWKVLNAKDYGIPQSRERVYVVIIRKDMDNGKFAFPAPVPLELRLQELLESDVDEKYYLSRKLLNKLLDQQNDNGSQEDKQQISQNIRSSHSLRNIRSARGTNLTELEVMNE